MEDFSAKDVVVKKEKEYSESETERSGSDIEKKTSLLLNQQRLYYMMMPR
jgi:hypothetical protein